MDRKIPHVLGHEVCGEILESDDARFPVGENVFVHHHAPCLNCEQCRKGHPVHCDQWKRTKLVPGGMAEYFAVASENLNDAFLTVDLRPRDAALIEPLACVAKSFRMAFLSSGGGTAVIGLGTMGLMHMLAGTNATGFDLSQTRLDWATKLGLDARRPSQATGTFDFIFVCPGSSKAIQQAIEIGNPGATIVLFAPVAPGEALTFDLGQAYFKDLRLVSSYSCGPEDTRKAYEWLKAGRVRAEQVVSDFIEIDDLPTRYQQMKAGEILKAMVEF
jgi:L-iditol 2-dehydrogenase